MEDPDSGSDDGQRLRAHDLVREGKLDELRAFLTESPASVHTRSFSGTPLSVAIHCKNIEAIRIILDAGATPLEDESFGNQFATALEWASAFGNRDIVRLLLGRPMIPPSNGPVLQNETESERVKRLVQSAFLAAAAYGQTSIVGEFLDTLDCSHKDIGYALLTAVGRWEADVVDLILDRVQFEKAMLDEALLKAVSAKDYRSDEARSGIIYEESDWPKHYRLVCRLIDESGMDVRQLELGSPLLRQVLDKIERRGALEALLDKGVDPNTQWENDTTPLHLLSSPIRVGRNDFKMHEEGIRMLREKGASLTTRDNEGATASHLAAEGADTTIFLRYYLPVDEDMALTNRYGETLLHYAAAGGKHETVEYLLSRGGFDVNNANTTSWTPIICALAPNGRTNKSEADAVKSARFLLHHGAGSDAVTAQGWSVLHVLGSYNDRKERRQRARDSIFMSVSGEDDDDEEEEEELDESASAAGLARELLHGTSELPPIDSPAKVYYSAPSNEDRSKTGYQRDLYSRRAVRKCTQVDKSSPDITVVLGRTPLHWAAERGATGVVRVLRELGGADVKATDSEGSMPWDLAKKSPFIWDESIRDATKRAVE